MAEITSEPATCEHCGTALTDGDHVVPILWVTALKDNFCSEANLIVCRQVLKSKLASADAVVDAFDMARQHGHPQMLAEAWFALVKYKIAVHAAKAGEDGTMTRGISTEFETEDPPEAPEDEPSADRWGWALERDTEFWHGANSRQEAIDAAIEAARAENREEDDPAGDVRVVWIQAGTQATVDLCLPSAELLIDNMNDAAADSGCPDEIDEPVTVIEGGEEALDALLKAWAAKYVKTNWWEAFGEPERIEVPPLPADAGTVAPTGPETGA